jgi:hypothetical protein
LNRDADKGKTKIGSNKSTKSYKSHRITDIMKAALVMRRDQDCEWQVCSKWKDEYFLTGKEKQSQHYVWLIRKGNQKTEF